MTDQSKCPHFHVHVMLSWWQCSECGEEFVPISKVQNRVNRLLRERLKGLKEREK